MIPGIPLSIMSTWILVINHPKIGLIIGCDLYRPPKKLNPTLNFMGAFLSRLNFCPQKTELASRIFLPSNNWKVFGANFFGGVEKFWMIFNLFVGTFNIVS